MNNSPDSAILAAKLDALQHELMTSSTDGKETNALRDYLRGIHEHLLGTASLLNAQASNELRQSQEGNIAITRRAALELKYRIKMTEVILATNSGKSLTGLMVEVENLLQKIYADALLNNVIATEEIVELKGILRRRDNHSAEYAHLDFFFLHHEICDSKNPKQLIACLEKYAENRFLLIAPPQQELHEIAIWKEIQEKGQEILALADLLSEEGASGSFLDANKLSTMQEYQTKMNVLGDQIKYMIEQLSTGTLRSLPREVQEKMHTLAETKDLLSLSVAVKDLIQHTAVQVKNSGEEIVNEPKKKAGENKPRAVKKSRKKKADDAE